jgi:hypothetical protein
LYGVSCSSAYVERRVDSDPCGADVVGLSPTRRRSCRVPSPFAIRPAENVKSVSGIALPDLTTRSVNVNRVVPLASS